MIVGKLSIERVMVIVTFTLACSGCAGVYIPVVGIGQDSTGRWSFVYGGGSGAAGAAGIGVNCGTTCRGDPNGEVCREFRKRTAETCGIKIEEKK